MKLSIKEILNSSRSKFLFHGDNEILNIDILQIGIDSRKIAPNEMFVAIKGDNFDGHSFIPDVLSKNPLACVVSRDWFQQGSNSELGGNFIVVNDTLTALQDISSLYRSKFNIPVFALTGSNGKTTTKEMVSNVLGEKYSVLRNKGNLNNHIGVPLTLFEMTAAHSFAVIEMGTNHFGEIKRLAEIAKPGSGLITNIGPAHLEFFKNLEGVSKAKRELWDYLENHGEIAFVNIDDPMLRNNLPTVKNVITYGFENPANVQGKYLGIDQDGRSRFMINNTEIKLGIVGMHNIYNALAAATVGLEFDLDLNQIKNALERFLPTSKRMEIVRGKGFVVINDCYNSNPESARKSLITLSQMEARGQRIAILADMLELGIWAEKEHRLIGEFAASLENIDCLLAYGPLSNFTVEQASKAGLQNAVHFMNKSELIAYLKNNISEGDILLVKGSRGMAMEEVTNVLTES